MCGRFGLFLPAKTIASFFLILNEPEVPPRYNIAPTQPVLAVREDQSGRRGDYLRWGLVPHWARDIKIGAKLSNARAETLHEKPSFRGAYKYRRCLIPAAGFYEWKTEGGRKQPYLIQRDDGLPLAFAGLWESWLSPDQSEIESCTVITTVANRDMEPVHHRMPVILEPDQFARWLAPEPRQPKDLADMLRPLPDRQLVLRPVDPYVNRTGNEGRRCIATVPTPATPDEASVSDSGQMSLFD